MSLSKRKLAAVILGEYVEDYSLELGLREQTIYGKRGTLKRFLSWLGDKPFNADSCRQWVRHLRRKGWKPVSIKHEVRILRATVRFLFKRGYIDQDFALDIPYPRIHKKPLEIVPIQLAEKIILAGSKDGPGDNVRSKARKKEYRAALRFILRTGLRNREARDLRDSDFNLESETFIVRSKSGNLDVLPVPRDMIGEVRRRVKNDRLFSKLRAERLNIVLKRGCRRLGVKTRVRTHSLRHVFCTSLLKQGVSMPIVSRLMRHASVAITDKVYAHYNIDDLRQALNGRHPLIKQGLTPQQVFDMVEQTVKRTEVDKDRRFKTSFNRSSGELIIKISL